MEYKFEIGEGARILGTPHVGRIIGRGWSFWSSANPKKRYLAFGDFPRHYTIKIGEEKIELELGEEKLQRVTFQSTSVIEGIVKRRVFLKTVDNRLSIQ
ncbi:MAG TPA: hypothetical protein ENH99_02570 [Candidatus Pacearchaeota archaeon]|nr:hypothetical protein [Candidatus Pacearchaeota archaeon]